MNGLKIGSLFSGYGGLDMAVESVTGARTVWVSDIDKGACKILAHRYPDVPNLGDLTAIDWAAVEPVDIITGGFPCQDLSHAGKRAGMASGTRSGLWSYMAEAIDTIRPRLVVAENVRGLLSAEALRPVEPCTWCVGDESALDLRALGAVLADLADIGYDAQWCGLRAADVGASHGRFRVFLVAHPRREPGEVPAGWELAAEPQSARHGDPRRTGLLPTPRTSDSNGAGAHGEGGVDLRTAVSLLPTPTTEPNTGNGHARYLGGEVRQLLPTPRAGDGEKGGPNQRGSSGDFMLPSAVTHLLPTPMVGSTSPAAHGQISGDFRAKFDEALARFGDYAAAIARWESVIGRPAPSPTEPTGKAGAHRLSPRFTEFMMGLPDGWITDVPGITRNEALKACGNGVVPQQAAAVLRHMLATSEVAA